MGAILDTTFAASRKRNVTALASAGISGSQPTGRALPLHIVGALVSAAEHVRARAMHAMPHPSSASRSLAVFGRFYPPIWPTPWLPLSIEAAPSLRFVTLT